MEVRNEINGDQKMEEMMLPGFRFHPTDEELVGFYLKRKVQERPISIELIKPLDIYKHDPWDLPKLATTGEKEWYFYCQRDRKYQNSARPNRVTVAGFWKATGTDRPIYSSDGSRCIGLKKSLVFYQGRAAKGTKTDWMMHEFRLPSVTKRLLLEKTVPPNELWAICRIFKKASSNAQRERAHSYSWISPVLLKNPPCVVSQHGKHDFQYLDHKPLVIDPTPPPTLTTTTNNKKAPQTQISKSSNQETNSPLLAHDPTRYNATTIDIDASSLLFDMPPSIFGDYDKQGFDYINMTNEEQRYANISCFSSASRPILEMQESDPNEAHIMLQSPTHIAYLDDQWNFSNTEPPCYM